MYVDFLLHTCESVHCVLQNDRERGVTWSYIRYVTIHREGWIQYLKSPKARPGETQWPPSWLFYTAKLLRWRWHRWDADWTAATVIRIRSKLQYWTVIDSAKTCKNTSQITCIKDSNFNSIYWSQVLKYTPMKHESSSILSNNSTSPKDTWSPRLSP